jgi:hypothetical protein
MSQPALLTLSRTASVVGGLLWASLAPVFVYADSALDRPGTAGFALAISSMWLVGVASLLPLLLGLRSALVIRSRSVGPIWHRPESLFRHSRSQQWPWGIEL